MTQDYSRGYNLNNLKSLLSFVGKVKKENLDEKTLQIFEFFDSNHNGEIEKTELNEILGKVTSYGASQDKSIFDNEEVLNFISTYKNKENKTLKQLGITGEQLFEFLDKIKTKVNNTVQNTPTEQYIQIFGMTRYALKTIPKDIQQKLESRGIKFTEIKQKISDESNELPIDFVLSAYKNKKAILITGEEPPIVLEDKWAGKIKPSDGD